MLAEILGTQFAWWQLGFTARRAVLRAARRGIPFPDPDVRQVAVDWAVRRLAAPRWWRVVRDGGTTVLGMVCLAALANVMAEADGLVALSGAAACCVPLTACWLRRQARHARLLAGMAPGDPPDPVPLRGLVFRALVVLLVTGAAAATAVLGVAADRAARPDCPPFTVDAPVLAWLARAGEGCPTGDTVEAAGLRYTPWTVPDRFTGRRVAYVAYVPPGSGALLLTTTVFTAWRAAGGPSGRLGEPIDAGASDLVAYANFHAGTIVQPAGRPPAVHMGRYYDAAGAPDDACVPRDRPCVTTAYADAAGAHIGWRYGSADAFNVMWWPRGHTELVTQREVAGYDLTLTGLRPSTVYVVEVAACRKRFLRRSECTWPSARVAFRVG